MSEASLPTGWRTGSVGELADFVRGVTYKRAQGSSKPSDGHVPLLRATNIVEGKIVEEDLVYVPSSVVSPSQVLKDGDLLLATSSGSLTVVGKSAPVRGLTNTCFGAFCGVLRPRRETNQQFLQRYIQSQSVRDSWSSAARGTNINNLKPTTILQTPMPIPPPEEQDRIVEILEEQLSRLDAAVKSVQTVREKAAQFRRSLLRATLHGRAVSENWAWHCLGEVSQMSLGKMLDRKHETGRFATKYLRNINVRWGQFDLRDLAQMDIAPHELERVSLRSGDVVVCEGGEPGRAAVWSLDEPIAIQKALHRVRPSRDLSSRFLAYLFETEFRGSPEHALFTGTTIAHLPKEKLRNLKIPFPSFQKQEEVADFLDEQVSWLNSALGAADEVERKTNALRRSLLHAAFTGELTRSWREAHV